MTTKNRNLKGGEKMKVIISLSIDYELIKEIDRKKGTKSRSEYICEVLRGTNQTTNKKETKKK